MIFAHFIASVQAEGVPVMILAILMVLLFASICLVYAAIKVFKSSPISAVLLGALATAPWFFLVVRGIQFLISANAEL